MSRLHIAILLSIYTSLTSALNLAPLQIINTGPTTSPSSPLSVKNNSLTANPIYTCIGGLDYGDEISLSSCYDAATGMLEHLPFRAQEFIFGDRRGAGGRAGVQVLLPYISISRTYVPNSPTDRSRDNRKLRKREENKGKERKRKEKKRNNKASSVSSLTRPFNKN